MRARHRRGLREGPYRRPGQERRPVEIYFVEGGSACLRAPHLSFYLAPGGG